MPSHPIVAGTVLVAPSAIASALLAFAFYFGDDRILQLVFWITPPVCIYTLVVFCSHRRRFAESFWAAELMFLVIPLTALGGWLGFNLLMYVGTFNIR